jgi:hypothetical protein
VARSPVLPVFTADAPRYLPRGADGRFVPVRHSAQRRKILNTAQRMRIQLGLEPHPALQTEGSPS